MRLEGHNRSLESGEYIVAPSTLRFRTAEEVAASLARAGFAVESTYGDWRWGPFKPESWTIITVARRGD